MKHGKCDTRLYRIWTCMKSRCYNKNNKRYSHYGGRGIILCDEWCNLLGIKYPTVKKRIYSYHWDVYKALGVK